MRTRRTDSGRRRKATALGVTLAIAAGLLTPIAIATVAQAATELSIDSLGLQAAAGSLTDGKCESTAGTCTLRAAIQESNAINGAAGEVKIGVDPDFAGGNIAITNTAANRMVSTNLYAANGAVAGGVAGDSGASFEITAPVTVDLEHKITVHPTGAGDLALVPFHLNGPDITLRAVDDIWAGETSIYIGPNAARVTLDEIEIQTETYYPERFFVVRGGAEEITVSNSTIGGFAANERDWNWGVVDGTSASFPVKGLTVTGNTYVAGAASGACNGSTAAGCTSTPVEAYEQHITELEFTGNVVQNINRASASDARGLDLRYATVGKLKISDNTFTAPYYRARQAVVDLAYATLDSFEIIGNDFTEMSGNGDVDDSAAAIVLPTDKRIGTGGKVSDNEFTATGTLNTQAVYWNGLESTDSATNLADSRVSIVDNHFDGFSTSASRSSIRMTQTGVVEIARNTFGARSGSQANTVLEEFAGNGSVASTLVNNLNASANAKLNTWWPTARTSANVQTTPLTAAECTVPLEVAPPADAENTTDYAAGRYPAVPVALDVYWTRGNDAEVYLGRYDVDADERQTLQVALPMPGDAMLEKNSGVGPVDPITGAVTGGLRVQTIESPVGSASPSSQYSRVAVIDGSCRPVITIAQATTQNEETHARDLHFTLTSSMQLDPSTVAIEDFVVEATSATSEGLDGVAAGISTIDADRLAPRVVSVTEVAGSSGTQFDVIVRVDDTATVTVSIGENTVAIPTGLANISAATTGDERGTDNVVTFVNPITAQPSKFTVVTGDERGKNFTYMLAAGAPAPTEQLKFTTSVSQPAGTPKLSLSTTSPVIAGGASQTSAIVVTAASGDAEAGTKTTISASVATGDSNYDGLLVPDVTPYLYATDPVINIAKRAYVDVIDSSSVQRIEATGSPAPRDSRLTDGQPVCFVYTVTNTSADDWVTVLRDIQVRDSDERLGDAGLIGTIPSLESGDSVKLFSCVSLIPADTTVDGPIAESGEAP
ncbi:hypothetical protein [Microbacterium sp. UFMG61]|uniref:hypothetical protein n=1 Tax=Microbacterium sp. UFMG61 TaxID=2745935 RepID=UPI00188E35DC|nr:hypothetical protein [Microbacterium sp. UFMG61]